MNAQHKLCRLKNRRNRLVAKARRKDGLTQRQSQRLDALNKAFND